MNSFWVTVCETSRASALSSISMHELFVTWLPMLRASEHLVALPVRKVTAKPFMFIMASIPTVWGVRAGAGADHHDRAADLLADEAVRFGPCPIWSSFPGHGYSNNDRMGTASVAVEERILANVSSRWNTTCAFSKPIFSSTVWPLRWLLSPAGTGSVKPNCVFAVVHRVAVGLYLFRSRVWSKSLAFG